MDLLLVPTISCGVFGTLMLRASQGLRRPGPTGLAIAAFVLATVGLARLLRRHVGGMLLIVVGAVLIDLQVHA